MQTKKPSPSQGARDLVAFITAASQAGFHVECRTYGPFHDWVSVSVMLEERGAGPSRTTCAGAFSVYVVGGYAGDRLMTHASGVGIALAREARVLGAGRARDLEAVNDANAASVQREWLARAQRELARRAEYQATLDATYNNTKEVQR